MSRPSISPLAWAGLAAWGASRVGTELALLSWSSSTWHALAVGWLAVLCCCVGLAICRRTTIRIVAGAAAAALIVALAHGAWLGATSSALEARGVCEWHATVCADPLDGQFGVSIPVRLDDTPWGLTVLSNWPKGEPVPRYGQRVVLSGRLRCALRGLPASGDAFRSGELVRCTPWRVRIGGWAGQPLGAIASWRAASVERLRRIGGTGAEALSSMLFRTPSAGAGVAALQDAKIAGVAWAITTSGLHLAVIVLLVDRLGALVGLQRRGRAILNVVVLGIVTVAAGLRVSLLRAALAASATVLARLCGRRRDATAALGAILVLFAVFDPQAATDVGLALGVIAVGAIALFSVLATSWLRPVVGRGLSRALGTSAVAQVAVAPLAAALFGGVSLVGPVALLLSAPLVAGAVTLGFAGAAGAAVWGGAGDTLLRLGSVVADVCARIWSLLAGLPHAFAAVPTVPWWVGAVWIAGAVGLWLWWPRPRRASRVRIGIVAIAVLLALSGSRAAPLTCGVEVMDVGQGDSILIRDGAHAVLVDTGPDPVVLRQALVRAGVSALDGLVLTHPHADHVGGLDGLAGIARPGWIGLPDVGDPSVEALARRCADRSDKVVRLHRDMAFEVGDTKVRVLWPTGGETGLQANDMSVVLLVERGGRRAILLGDAEEQAQRGALDAWSSPVEMLKVGHHGSRNGTVPSAVAVWRPKIALISVGAGNPFGHPHREALDALAAVGAVVHRTDLEGDLVWDLSAAAGPVMAAAPRSVTPIGLRVALPLCDNLSPGVAHATSARSDRSDEPWPPATSPTSSPSTSSTALSRCCWNAPRSGSGTVWPPWPISTSTWRPSTARPPPRTMSSTPPTLCRS